MEEPEPPAALIAKLEECLRELWQVTEFERTCDGDYTFPWGADFCWVRLLDDGSYKIAAFGILVADVSLTLELLTELNDMNTTTRGVHTYWLERNVYSCELIDWDDLDSEHLAPIINSVAYAATELGPTMAVMHGGIAMSECIEYREVAPRYTG